MCSFGLFASWGRLIAGQSDRTDVMCCPLAYAAVCCSLCPCSQYVVPLCMLLGLFADSRNTLGYSIGKASGNNDQLPCQILTVEGIKRMLYSISMSFWGASIWRWCPAALARSICCTCRTIPSTVLDNRVVSAYCLSQYFGCGVPVYLVHAKNGTVVFMLQLPSHYISATYTIHFPLGGDVAGDGE